MSEHIVKRHNKTLLLCHLVFPAKYRRGIFTPDVEGELKHVCAGMGGRYEIHFVEIGADEDHVHFLVQSVPRLSVTGVVTKIKSLTARGIFGRMPEVRRALWGGNLWASGCYANTVGQYANEDVIRNYVKAQGKNYRRI